MGTKGCKMKEGCLGESKHKKQRGWRVNQVMQRKSFQEREKWVWVNRGTSLPEACNRLQLSTLKAKYQPISFCVDSGICVFRRQSIANACGMHFLSLLVVVLNFSHSAMKVKRSWVHYVVRKAQWHIFSTEWVKKWKNTAPQKHSQWTPQPMLTVESIFSVNLWGDTML